MADGGNDMSVSLRVWQRLLVIDVQDEKYTILQYAAQDVSIFDSIMILQNFSVLYYDDYDASMVLFVNNSS